MSHYYLIHYGEIALKGKNRPQFEQQLVDNIQRQHPVDRVARLGGRMVAQSQVAVDLTNVLGIAWWAEALPLPLEVERIRREGLRLARAGIEGAGSFAVRVSRADKRFPMRSRELEALVGGDLDRAFDAPVDLDHPDFTLHIEIAEGTAYLYTDRHEGWRGLPVGISGHLFGLYSAGIDSAVAAFLMGKRGASVELVHFHALPDGAQAHADKAGTLARRIAHYLPSLRVHYVPYHHFQLATMGLDRDQRQELVVFRRFMARIADRLALEAGALGIFSGDNLGQVASQTLENLRAVDLAIESSIYRPLIAYDKQEIIDLGIDLGFDEIANREYKDCCSIIAQHPATRANLERVRSIEARIGVPELIERSLAEAVTYDYAPSGEGIEAAESLPAGS